MNPAQSQTAYDDLAYLGGSFAFAHPNRLAGAAQLFGHTPVNPAHCRVLEIGCGEGGNLVPLAFSLPHAECVGVDLAQTAITTAERYIAALGLTNVTVQCMDLSLLSSAQFGKFDYIIAHGVFSWVPDSVRTALLRVTSELLSDGGVAMISYNALPGCRTRHLLREMLQFKQRGLPYEAQRVPEARDFLQSLAALEAQSDKPHFSALQKELKFATRLSEHVLFHDDLAPHTKAFHLSDFVAMAQEQGLQFAGDADLTEMFKFDPQLQASPEIGDWIAAQAGGDWVAQQQYTDFLFGTRFRRTLLRRATAQIAPAPIGAALNMLHFRGMLRQSAKHPMPGLNDNGALHLEGADGLEAAIRVPLLKHAIVQMLRHPDQSWTLASLETASRASMQAAACAVPPGDGLADSLRSFIGQMVKVAGVRLFAQSISDTPPKQPPTLHRLARHQLENGKLLIDKFQESLRLEGALTTYVALCMDGRSLDTIAAQLGALQKTLSPQDPRYAELIAMQERDIPANLQALAHMLNSRGQLRSS